MALIHCMLPVKMSCTSSTNLTSHYLCIVLQCYCRHFCRFMCFVVSNIHITHAKYRLPTPLQFNTSFTAANCKLYFLSVLTEYFRRFEMFVNSPHTRRHYLLTSIMKVTITILANIHIYQYIYIHTYIWVYIHTYIYTSMYI